MKIVHASGPLLAVAVALSFPPVPEEMDVGVPDSESGVGDKSPSVVGAWDAPLEWPLIPIHAALLKSGKVLQY